MTTSVIKEEDIKKGGAYNVRDVLKPLTRLNVMEAGMTGNQVSIRGMGTSSTLILIDGRRLAGEDSGSTMNVYELNRMSLDEVECIEVMRGAGSGLYGSNAMGGVINIIIKKNKKAGGYVGTWLGGREQALYGGVLTGKVGKLNLDVNYNLTEVRKSDRDGDSNMYGPRRYVDFKGRCQFDETRGLSFGASYMKEQYGSFSEGDPTAMSASARDDMTEWYDNNRQSYFVKYDGYHSKNDYEFQNDYNRLGKESRKKTPGVWRDFDHSKYETYVVEAKNTYHVDEHHTVTYGGEYRKQKAGGTRLGTGAGKRTEETYLGMTKPYGSADVKSYAFYVQDEWNLTDILFFVPSLRYDHHDSFGGELSPRTSLTYAMSKNSRIKTNYGAGYRSPSIFELYSHMDRNMGRMQVQVWGNEHLDPEKPGPSISGLRQKKIRRGRRSPISTTRSMTLSPRSTRAASDGLSATSTSILTRTP